MQKSEPSTGDGELCGEPSRLSFKPDEGASMQEEWGKFSPSHFLEFGQFDFLNLVPDLALFNLSVKLIAKAVIGPCQEYVAK